MELYVGLDVGLQETSLCVVDREGKSVREAKVTTDPQTIRASLAVFGDGLQRIGLEASPIGLWLYRELRPVFR